MGALLLVAFLAARLPRGISPRLPWWLAGVILVGALLALVSGGPPDVHVASLKIGLGGLGNFGRFTMVGVDVLAAAALLGWTTPLADLSPALGRLLGPLRRLRVPVDELGALANAIRRAREIAEAIEARGGVPTPSPETHPFRRVDTTTLALCALGVAAMAVLR